MTDTVFNTYRLFDMIERRVVVKILVLLFICQAQTALSGTSNDGAMTVLRAQSPHLALPSKTPVQPVGSAKAVTVLQGRAEVQQQLYTNLQAWQAAQAYRQAVVALSAKDFSVAAKYFRQAGDAFASAGEGRFLAQSRFAEAQSLRLLKQNEQAANLFEQSVELFRKYEPNSRFLKAALDQLNYLKKGRQLKGKIAQTEPTFQALPALRDTVSRTVPLKGKITQLQDGTSIASLKDNDFFTGGRLLPQAASVDVSDGYVRDTVYKAFVQMDCLEFTALGGNYLTAPENYKAFKADGKTVVVGAMDDFGSPVIGLTLNGRQYRVCMDLPGMSKYSKNVLVVTDGQHVLAIDPRTRDTWKLVASFAHRKPDFSWSKLIHDKKG